MNSCESVGVSSGFIEQGCPQGQRHTEEFQDCALLFSSLS